MHGSDVNEEIDEQKEEWSSISGKTNEETSSVGEEGPIELCETKYDLVDDGKQEGNEKSQGFLERLMNFLRN